LDNRQKELTVRAVALGVNRPAIPRTARREDAREQRAIVIRQIDRPTVCEYASVDAREITGNHNNRLI
jgi:hypothetical protein